MRSSFYVINITKKSKLSFMDSPFTKRRIKVNANHFSPKSRTNLQVSLDQKTVVLDNIDMLSTRKKNGSHNKTE
ncbi:hypothetical protein H5410_048056 [Solanum commersonii]|uniref:Uncharacterized protein n=1 Tax=Solanum commersonii TaxID=4109 RepID=A0A9J5XKJ0_SOLCO|nr:hypothetical protein H5410_048056 [Solanum commersonii]